MPGSSKSGRWGTVDNDPKAFANYLETLTPLLAEMKRLNFDALRLTPGASVLDVGCGLGRDVETLLRGVPNRFRKECTSAQV